MIRTVLCAASLAVAATTTLAGAAPACGTDPRGDVHVSVTPRAVVDAKHLDIVSYDIARNARTLTVSIRTAGGTGYGRWWTEFEADGTSYDISTRVDMFGSLVDDPRTAGPDGFSTYAHAFRDGTGREAPAVATLRDGEVRVTVSLPAFGSFAPRRGARFRDIRITASENVGVTLVDEATRARCA